MPYDQLLKGRHSLANRAYFITSVTHAREPLFRELTPARLLVREMRRLHDNGTVASLAWVIMPDHMHWLVQLGERLPLEAVVKSLKGRSALAINRHRKRHGTVWQRGYHEHAVRRHEDIRQVARYIVANPLRAGLVDEIGRYPNWDCIWLGDGRDGSLVE